MPMKNQKAAPELRVLIDEYPGFEFLYGEFDDDNLRQESISLALTDLEGLLDDSLKLVRLRISTLPDGQEGKQGEPIEKTLESLRSRIDKAGVLLTELDEPWGLYVDRFEANNVSPVTGGTSGKNKE